MIEEGPYELVKKNPLPKLIEGVKNMLKSCTTLISSEDKWKFISSNPVLPRLYALTKIHKIGNQIRPIVSAINSPTYKLSQWLNSTFSKLQPPPGFSYSSYSYLNSLQLAQEIKNIKLFYNLTGWIHLTFQLYSQACL